MAEQITLSECNNYVDVKSVGSSQKHDLIGTIMSIKFISEKYNIYKVFVDSQERHDVPSKEDQLLIAKYLADETKGKISFAILTSIDPKDLAFFEAAVSLHGGKVAYFNSKKSAINWLEQR